MNVISRLRIRYELQRPDVIGWAWLRRRGLWPAPLGFAFACLDDGPVVVYGPRSGYRFPLMVIGIEPVNGRGMLAVTFADGCVRWLPPDARVWMRFTKEGDEEAVGNE